MIDDHSFWWKVSLSGGIAASSTHLLVIPLDVLKIRMQMADIPSSSSSRISFSVFSHNIYKTEGLKGFLKGVAPTNWGYFFQGSLKYGLYEHFKSMAPKIFGLTEAKKNRNAIYLTSGILAEAIADLALTPFEAARIRAIASKGKNIGTHKLIFSLYKEGTLYRGFWPLFARQVPYTAVKFAVFERSEEYIYKLIDDLYSKKRETDLSSSTQLMVTALCGGFGGFASAIISHPADTLLTRVNQKSYVNFNILYKEIGGCNGFWKGLGPRLSMVTILASLQLLVYDACKVGMFGLETSHGLY